MVLCFSFAGTLMHLQVCSHLTKISWDNLRLDTTCNTITLFIRRIIYPQSASSTSCMYKNTNLGYLGSGKWRRVTVSERFDMLSSMFPARQTKYYECKEKRSYRMTMAREYAKVYASLRFADTKDPSLAMPTLTEHIHSLAPTQDIIPSRRISRLFHLTLLTFPSFVESTALIFVGIDIYIDAAIAAGVGAKTIVFSEDSS
ncbi:hypothetical protein BDP27DRAFT_1336809 [Rhodocollybia butyracea]|uniref:Uncharacterized protein n=1 Tax=Rhodocollybia butyracea TaxID=206335 RepID=A0A9P5PC41_9AGAR|nr:hypothetical protein BDP27DRAFT_1336809 [Rhodocollybia butyracea]